MTSANKFDHERLDVYHAAMDFLVVAVSLIESLPPKQTNLADQLQRASTSIILNIAEGAGEFSRREKARFYRMALRSATECAAIIDIFTRLDLVDASALSEGRDLLIRTVAMLTKMIHGLEQPGTGTGTGTGDGYA